MEGPAQQLSEHMLPNAAKITRDLFALVLNHSFQYMFSY